MCSKWGYQKNKTFFRQQQAVNKDKNIESDENEPMDVDTSSQQVQGSHILNNVPAKSVIL